MVSAARQHTGISCAGMYIGASGHPQLHEPRTLNNLRHCHLIADFLSCKDCLILTLESCQVALSIELIAQPSILRVPVFFAPGL
jgi:hypothetical protein